MRSGTTVVALAFLFFFLVSCNSKSAGSKWRMTDKSEYKLLVHAQTLFTDMDELEQVLLIPVSYLERDHTPVTFEQHMTYHFDKEMKGEKTAYTMTEDVKGVTDAFGAFHVSYRNDKNEGWEMIWKDNFLYRKLLGGEFSRTFSMGEHEFFRESQFKMIPEIYTIFRDYASVKRGGKNREKGCREATVTFDMTQHNRTPLPHKRYLQNSEGVEEMKNDHLIAHLAKEKFSDLHGVLHVCVSDDFTPVLLSLSLSVTYPEKGIVLNIEGTRETRRGEGDTIVTPSYAPEYHRRSMDATRNIMKKRGHNGKEQ